MFFLCFDLCFNWFLWKCLLGVCCARITFGFEVCCARITFLAKRKRVWIIFRILGSLEASFEQNRGGQLVDIEDLRHVKHPQSSEILKEIAPPQTSLIKTHKFLEKRHTWTAYILYCFHSESTCAAMSGRTRSMPIFWNSSVKKLLTQFCWKIAMPSFFSYKLSLFLN